MSSAPGRHPSANPLPREAGEPGAGCRRIGRYIRGLLRIRHGECVPSGRRPSVPTTTRPRDGLRPSGPSDVSRRLDMFYSVASPDWKPGQPLTPAGALLFRTRSEAEAFAPDCPSVAVAVRFDQHWRVIRPQGA